MPLRARFGAISVAGLLIAAFFAPWAAGSFPGRNGKIAFEDFGRNNGLVGTINPDGTALRWFCALHPLGDFDLFRCSSDSTPAWSADGRRLAFSSNRPGDTDSLSIWVMRPDGTAPRRVTPNFPGLDANSPTWSPDGSKIVFRVVSFKGIDADLYVLNANGTSLTRLTDTETVDEWQPDWSPDGSRIAYSTPCREDLGCTSNVHGIELINSDGTGRTAIPGTEQGFGSSWSPDGTQILFHGGNIIRPDGSDARQIPSVNGRDAVWSPDGTKIAFERKGAIFVVNIDGSGLRRLTRFWTVLNFTSMAWQPVVCTLTGTPGPDVLVGTAAPDVMCGEGGDDKLRGVGAEDHLYGDSGNDVLYATGAGAIVQGGVGNDVIFGTRGRNTLEGGSGDDRLIGRAGADWFSGGPGGDVILGGKGKDAIEGDDGDDVLSGGRGDDKIISGRGNDRVRGGQGRDFLFGEIVQGGDGNDRLFGNGRRNRLQGGAGDDRVTGYAGGDFLSGGAGNDFLSGGAGNDVIQSRDGIRDRIICGGGFDKVIADALDLVPRTCESVKSP